MSGLRLAVLSLSLGLSATAARAQPEDLRDRFGRESPFATDPTLLKNSGLIPRAVLRTREMQSADLRCRVGPAGTLVECRVDWESVVGIGLCQAALAAVPSVRLKARFPDGGQTEGLYASLQMIFDVGGKPPYAIIPAAVHLSETPVRASPHPFDARQDQIGAGCNSAQ